MEYQYSGYLKTLLDAPRREVTEALDAIVFGPEDIERWTTKDLASDKEWMHIPARVKRSGETVTLTGRFEMVRRIDNLDRDDPSFWVPLSSTGSNDPRFPIDLARYPVVEITYRCTTPWARPAWQFNYDGGTHFDGLAPVREWRTIARRIAYFGSPQQIDSVTLRLYSVSRSTEALEVQSIRFRAMSPEEAEACRSECEVVESKTPPKHYPLLDEFLPLGVTIVAHAGRRLAEMMDVGFLDYMRAAIEDVARNRHNCIALENVETLSEAEFKEILACAERFGIRVFPQHNWPLDQLSPEEVQAHVDKHIAPFKDSSAVFAWAVHNQPPGHSFKHMLEARQVVEAADPNHPLAFMMRDPNSFPLLAPFFAASGISHFKSRSPWDVGHIIKRHLPMSRGQQFWITAPAFVYATDTPEWNTCPEMRLMFNAALVSGARGWFSFVYNNEPVWMGGHCQRSLTGPFLTFSDLWTELGLRMERMEPLTPLLLQSLPCEAPKWDIQVEAQFHQRSACKHMESPVQIHWLRNDSFWLMCLVSNDVSEVSSVYLTLGSNFPTGLAVYDISDFVRKRSWVNMPHHRHLEMFPGQAAILLIAEPDVCAEWHERIAGAMATANRQQIGFDLDFAHRFHLNLADIEDHLRKSFEGSPQERMAQTHRIRDMLTDLFYRTPEIAQPRSKLLQVSAAICGCDGALCRLLGKGKADPAHEMGLKLLPYVRELMRLRLAFYRGEGLAAYGDFEKLAGQCLDLLTAIRGMT